MKKTDEYYKEMLPDVCSRYETETSIYDGLTREDTDRLISEYKMSQEGKKRRTKTKAELLEDHQKYYEIQKINEEFGKDSIPSPIIKNGQYTYGNQEASQSNNQEKTYEETVNAFLEEFDFSGIQTEVNSIVEQGRTAQQILEYNNKQRMVEKIMDEGR